MDVPHSTARTFGTVGLAGMAKRRSAARAPRAPNAPAETGPQGSDSGRGILTGCCCATRWERAFDGHVWIEDARYERWQNKRACRCRTSPRTTFPMAKRLNTLVLAAEATVPATYTALPNAVQASIEQRCMNPACTKLCNWPRTGRPRLFCCRECRQALRLRASRAAGRYENDCGSPRQAWRHLQAATDAPDRTRPPAMVPHSLRRSPRRAQGSRDPVIGLVTESPVGGARHTLGDCLPRHLRPNRCTAAGLFLQSCRDAVKIDHNHRPRLNKSAVSATVFNVACIPGRGAHLRSEVTRYLVRLMGRSRASLASCRCGQSRFGPRQCVAACSNRGGGGRPPS